MDHKPIKFLTQTLVRARKNRDSSAPSDPKTIRRNCAGAGARGADIIALVSIGASSSVPQDSNVPVNAPDAVDTDAQESALVARMRAGDSAAWSDLIVRYQDRLFAVCVRMVHDRDLAADLTQDAFVKIIRGIDTFDGRAKLSTWMIRVTMNVCLSKLRSEKLRRHASLDAGGSARDEDAAWTTRVGARTTGSSGAHTLAAREPADSSEVQQREERARLLRSLAKLEPDQRAVLILADCQGLPYEQIAAVLGVAIGTVKSRVFRARTTLRDVYEKGDANDR